MRKRCSTRILVDGAVRTQSSYAAGSDWPEFKRDSARTGDGADGTRAFLLRRVLAAKFSAPIYASAAAGGKVFVGSTAGFPVVLKEVARIPAGCGEIGAPAAANDALYCLTFSVLIYEPLERR